MRLIRSARATGVVLVMVLISGCGAEPETMRAEDTVFGEQVKAYDAAKQVEDVLFESHADRDETLRKQGG